MYNYQRSYSKGHPLRLTKKERSRGVPAEIISDDLVYYEDGFYVRLVKYKTGIGTGVAKFNIGLEQGSTLYHKFLKLFERGKKR